MSIEEDIFGDFEKRRKEMSEDFDKDFKKSWRNAIILMVIMSVMVIATWIVIAMNADKIYNSAKTSIIHEIKDIKQQLKD
jgi:hypothetical protein